MLLGASTADLERRQVRPVTACLPIARCLALEAAPQLSPATATNRREWAPPLEYVPVDMRLHSEERARPGVAVTQVGNRASRYT